MSSQEAARAQLDAAKKETWTCENEIQQIKAAIKKVDAEVTGGEEPKPNSMEVSILKVEGLPESGQPIFSLQLSSPVEEQVLTKLFDPNDESSRAVFLGIDTSMATLTLTVKDAEIVVGSSEATDVAPLCPLDAMTPAPQYVSEIPIAIVAEGDENAEGEASGVVVPVCVVTLRVTYKPSMKDQKEELFDLLNKASQKKAESVDRLRKQAAAVGQATGPRSTGETSLTSKSPAVKRGFLNKKQPKGQNRFLAFYKRNLGPQSWARKTFWASKNYMIFFGAATLFHFKGQELALPAPV